MSTLAQFKVRATLHVSPDYLDNPVLVAYLRRCANDGHLVGVCIRDSVADGMLREYPASVTALLKTLINYEPTYLRFPVPGPSASALEIVSGLGYRVTFYNLDSQDYNYANDTSQSGQIFEICKQTLDRILPPSRGLLTSTQRDIVLTSAQQTGSILNYTLGV